MIGVLCVGFVGLCFVGVALCGALARIADAIDAQNKHYGITPAAPADKKEEAA